ncbi:unnamed protein product [Phytophthora fragariaefolia]|uniref:Unnamed protein product n=1 Tax=Phytophthora fragariaefolia TaxID=1490495 RepID=A0A9W7CX02_9STRA|nr:unnamed protein product [Phytophthora fragariaefolia]
MFADWYSITARNLVTSRPTASSGRRIGRQPNCRGGDRSSAAGDYDFGNERRLPMRGIVYAIPDEFDCILAIPFFEVIQPQIDGWSRRIEGAASKTLHRKRAEKTCEPIEEGGPVIASGFLRPVEAKVLSAKRPDSCRGAALETDVKLTDEAVSDTVQKKPSSVFHRRHDDAHTGKGSAGEDDDATPERDSTIGEADGSSSTKGKPNVVENMFRMGVVDVSGVQTKYITRKKLQKFLENEDQDGRRTRFHVGVVERVY